MRELQAKIIEEMGVQPRIDPAGEVRKRVTFLKEYLAATHTKGFVLGISGGLDSSLAGRLAQLAVEELEAEGTEANFVAVRLPYGVQHDEDDAQAALDFVRAKTEWTFNISAAVDGFEDEFEKTVGTEISDFHKGNTKARTRMIAQYALAGEHNYLVIGTDHGAESVTGFFTKFGDGGADILPLFGLNKRQNRALLAELGAPARIWEKVPTADLLDGKPGRTDEDYVLSLLRETGILCVYGSGFGVPAERGCFRIVFLPNPTELAAVYRDIDTFTREYTRRG